MGRDQCHRDCDCRVWLALRHQPLHSMSGVRYSLSLYLINAMANHSVVCTARRFALPFALFLIIILARHLLPTMLKLASPAPRFQKQFYIQGRWKPIRASLGLPPLPDIDNFPQNPHLIPSVPSTSRMSRFDLRRKRSIEANAQSAKPLQLRFAADALRQPSVPLGHMAASFRAIALAEKGITMEQARARLQKQGQTQDSQRRPSSWGTRAAKISLGKRR
jgi:hypothetical protein